MYVKSLARMESACVLREGLMSFMYNISYTKQSNMLLHFFRSLKRWSVFVLSLQCYLSFFQTIGFLYFLICQNRRPITAHLVGLCTALIVNFVQAY